MEIKTLRTRLGRCADYLGRENRTPEMDAYYAKVCRDAQEALKAIEDTDRAFARVMHRAEFPR